MTLQAEWFDMQNKYFFQEHQDMAIPLVIILQSLLYCDASL